MDVTPLISSDRQVIQSYKQGQFKVSGQVYDSPVLVYPDRVEAWDVSVMPADFSKDEFLRLFSKLENIDVCLIGAGQQGFFVLPEYRTIFQQGHVGLDVMDTGAACRTYNVLLAEGRRVVAALWPL